MPERPDYSLPKQSSIAIARDEWAHRNDMQRRGERLRLMHARREAGVIRITDVRRETDREPDAGLTPMFRRVPTPRHPAE